jgi:DNA polymerase-1
MKSENLKSIMIMQVHDELVFDVYPWEEEVLSENVERIMESILSDREIILKSDTLIWNSWKETK